MLTKDLLQDNSVSFYARYKRVGINWATGVGKTRAGCLCILRTLGDPVLDTNGIILIVTDSIAAKEITWPQQMKEWGVPASNRIIITTWRSLHMYNKLHVTLFIGDEAHSITEANSVFFNKNAVDHIVLLTATEPEKDEVFKKQMFQKLIGDKRMSLNVDQAVQHELVNNFRIIALQYEIEGEEWDAYFEICKQLQHAKQTGNQGYIDAMIGKRMHFVYNLPSKVAMARKFLNDEKARQLRMFICCGNIDQAEAFGLPTYHSKSKEDTNLKRFMHKEINQLVSVFSLRQGFNFEDMLFGFVIQVQARKRKFIQLLGRLLRGKPGQTGTMYVLVATNTIDATWYEQATRDISPNRKKTFNLKDL